MTLSKTDIIGYAALIGSLATGLKELFLSSKPVTVADWIVTGLSAVALIAWAFYDKLTGTKPTPTV